MKSGEDAMSGLGIKGGEGRIGSVEGDGGKCDCAGCTAQRLAYAAEVERHLLTKFPFPNAPTTLKLQ